MKVCPLESIRQIWTHVIPLTAEVNFIEGEFGQAYDVSENVYFIFVFSGNSVDIYSISVLCGAGSFSLGLFICEDYRKLSKLSLSLLVP